MDKKKVLLISGIVIGLLLLGGGGWWGYQNYFIQSEEQKKSSENLSDSGQTDQVIDFDFSKLASNDIAFVAPSAGEVLTAGDTVDISIAVKGDITELMLLAVRDGMGEGELWSEIIPVSETPGITSYSYTIPRDTIYKTRLVVIGFNDTGSIVDDSVLSSGEQISDSENYDQIKQAPGMDIIDFKVKAIAELENIQFVQSDMIITDAPGAGFSNALRAYYNNAPPKSITNFDNVTLSIDQPDIVEFIRPGVLAAKKLGVATIRGSYQGKEATAIIRSVPEDYLDDLSKYEEILNGLPGFVYEQSKQDVGETFAFSEEVSDELYDRLQLTGAFTLVSDAEYDLELTLTAIDESETKDYFYEKFNVSSVFAYSYAYNVLLENNPELKGIITSVFTEFADEEFDTGEPISSWKEQSEQFAQAYNQARQQDRSLRNFEMTYELIYEDEDEHYTAFEYEFDGDRLIETSTSYSVDGSVDSILEQNYTELKTIRETRARNPKIFDTDKDGLTDYEESGVWKTDANNSDSDGDGYVDGAELFAGYNPLGSGTFLLGNINSKPITFPLEYAGDSQLLVYSELGSLYAAVPEEDSSKIIAYIHSPLENHQIFFSSISEDNKMLILDYGVSEQNEWKNDFESMYFYDILSGTIEIIPPAEGTLENPNPGNYDFASYHLSPDGEKILRRKVVSSSRYEYTFDLYEFSTGTWRSLEIPPLNLGFGERTLRTPWHQDSEHIYVHNKFLTSGINEFDPGTVISLFNITTGEVTDVFSADDVCREEHNVTAWYASPSVVDESVFSVACLYPEDNTSDTLVTSLYLYGIDDGNLEEVATYPGFSDTQFYLLDSTPYHLAADQSFYLYFVSDLFSGITAYQKDLRSGEDVRLPTDANLIGQGRILSPDNRYLVYMDNLERFEIFEEDVLTIVDLDTNQSYSIARYEFTYPEDSQLSVVGWLYNN